MTTDANNRPSESGDIPKVTARPIHFTSNPAAATTMFAALGLRQAVADDNWQVFDAPGGGALAIHTVAKGDPLDGTTKLGFEVASDSDLDKLAARLVDQPGGAQASLAFADGGRVLQLQARDGLQFQVDVRPIADNIWPALPYRLEVNQMWFTRDVPAAQAVLVALGATTLVTAGTGWADTRDSGGGRTDVHFSKVPPRVSAGFELGGRLEPLRDRLEAAGFTDVAIMDEAWGRYLALTDDGLDGELSWVNEDQTDYYGYTVHQLP